MKTTKKDTNNNSILLALMFIIIIALLAYIIFFNGGNGKTEFYTEALSFQNVISNYIGNTQSEMFGAYEIENIITGYNSEGIEIKDINDDNIVPIADKDQKIKKDDKNYYKLNSTNIKEILKVDLPNYNNIEWYISQDGTLAVKIIGKTPNWWNDNFNSLKL